VTRNSQTHAMLTIDTTNVDIDPPSRQSLHDSTAPLRRAVGQSKENETKSRPIPQQKLPASPKTFDPPVAPALKQRGIYGFYGYATKYERPFLLVAAICAVIGGVVLPLMTVSFSRPSWISLLNKCAACVWESV
jgi:hypothetical protein